MKTAIKGLVIGPAGSGKSFHCGTYPRSYWISTEPGGYETVKMNPELSKNTVKQAYHIPSPILDVKEVFANIGKACIEAHQMASKGEIDTLILDNMTYLSENRWIYINKYEAEYTKDGVIDNRSNYGKLGRWLYEFTLMNLCSFPGNVIVTAHIKQESEEQMKKKLGTDDIVADILGGFRQQAPGMFSLVMFLDKIRQGENKYRYIARLNASENKLAKNRYNLPEIIDNVSYQTILNAILKAKGETK